MARKSLPNDRKSLDYDGKLSSMIMLGFLGDVSTLNT